MIFGLIKSAAAVVLVFGELMAIVWLAWVFIEKVYDAKQAQKKAKVDQIAENFRRMTEIANSVPCRTKDAVAAFERFGKAARGDRQ